jgi:Uri superfamily endonuclease
MPKLASNSVPSYRLHKQSGQAIVTLNGKDILLGVHSTVASKAEYNRRIAQWLGNGRRLPEATPDLTIAELMEAHRVHCDTCYRKPDGTPSGEARNIGYSLRPLRKLYNRTVVVWRSSVTAIGGRGGSYVLRIEVGRKLSLVFGGFKKGKRITIQPGTYSYVGSAMSQKGATCLSKRLLRHATHLGRHRFQSIRPLLLREFCKADLCDDDVQLPQEKKLHWNVDHLLNQPGVDLVGVHAIRTRENLEALLGKLPERDPATVVFELGLGANDVQGNTHLLLVDAGEEWWSNLPGRLRRFSDAITRLSKMDCYDTL